MIQLDSIHCRETPPTLDRPVTSGTIDQDNLRVREGTEALYHLENTTNQPTSCYNEVVEKIQVNHHHVKQVRQAPWQHRLTFQAIAQFPQADEFARLRLLAGLTTTSHARTTLKDNDHPTPPSHIIHFRQNGLCQVSCARVPPCCWRGNIRTNVCEKGSRQARQGHPRSRPHRYGPTILKERDTYGKRKALTHYPQAPAVA